MVTENNVVVVPESIMNLTPGANEYDVQALLDFRTRIDRKFSAEDAFKYTVMGELAERFILAYEGDFEYLVEMKDANRRRRLTPGMVKGVLNCWWADVVKLRRLMADELRQNQMVEQLKDEAAGIDTSGETEGAVVSNGYFTVNFEDGSHLTLRVNAAKGHPGTQKVAALIGSSNEHDYQPFGFIKGNRFIPFSAFRQGHDRWHAAIRLLIGLTDEERKAAGLLYAQESNNCMKCGRLLTDPVSIALGIGPTCRGE